jgi:GNAT superfamily N-acetyltransferase
VLANAPAAVLFSAAAEDRLVQLLHQAGFERHGGMEMMAVDLDRLGATTLPAGCSFARVSAVTDRQRWGDAFSRGYELPRRCGAAFAQAINDDASATSEIQYFWIRRDDQPICTSLLYLQDGVAGVYAVATVPEHRRKGLAAHVTAESLRIARRLGYRVGILQASAAGQPVYHRLGFTGFGQIPLFVRLPV